MKEISTTDRWELDIFRLDIIRKAKGITHQTISEQLNMQQSNISKFFSAANRPSYELIKSIANTIGIDVRLVDDSGKLNMDLVDMEANERLIAFDVSQVGESVESTVDVKGWWGSLSEKKQRKFVTAYFHPADSSHIDTEFGLDEDELLEIYERNQPNLLVTN